MKDSAYVFFRAMIEGRSFVGVMGGDGPTIEAGERDKPPSHAVLGPSSIRLFDKLSEPDIAPGWWIVKYQDERRLSLCGLSEAGVRELSKCFGIPVYGEGKYGTGPALFLRSEAGKGLCEWATLHANLAKSMRHCAEYIPWPNYVNVYLSNERKGTGNDGEPNLRP
jgi:hypothetical protein